MDNKNHAGGKRGRDAYDGAPVASGRGYGNVNGKINGASHGFQHRPPVDEVPNHQMYHNHNSGPPPQGLPHNGGPPPRGDAYFNSGHGHDAISRSIPAAHPPQGNPPYSAAGFVTPSFGGPAYSNFNAQQQSRTQHAHEQHTYTQPMQQQPIAQHGPPPPLLQVREPVMQQPAPQVAKQLPPPLLQMQALQTPSIQALPKAGRFSDQAPASAQASRPAQAPQDRAQNLPQPLPQAAPQATQAPAVLNTGLAGTASVGSTGVNTGLAAALAGLSQSQLNSLAGLLGQAVGATTTATSGGPDSSSAAAIGAAGRSAQAAAAVAPEMKELSAAITSSALLKQSGTGVQSTQPAALQPPVKPEPPPQAQPVQQQVTNQTSNQPHPTPATTQVWGQAPHNGLEQTQQPQQQQLQQLLQLHQQSQGLGAPPPDRLGNTSERNATAVPAFPGQQHAGMNLLVGAQQPVGFTNTQQQQMHASLVQQQQPPGLQARQGTELQPMQQLQQQQLYGQQQQAPGAQQAQQQLQQQNLAAAPQQQPHPQSQLPQQQQQQQFPQYFQQQPPQLQQQQLAQIPGNALAFLQPLANGTPQVPTQQQQPLFGQAPQPLMQVPASRAEQLAPLPQVYSGGSASSVQQQSQATAPHQAPLQHNLGPLISQAPVGPGQVLLQPQAPLQLQAQGGFQQQQPYLIQQNQQQQSLLSLPQQQQQQPYLASDMAGPHGLSLQQYHLQQQPQLLPGSSQQPQTFQQQQPLQQPLQPQQQLLFQNTQPQMQQQQQSNGPPHLLSTTGPAGNVSNSGPTLPPHLSAGTPANAGPASTMAPQQMFAGQGLPRDFRPSSGVTASAPTAALPDNASQTLFVEDLPLSVTRREMAHIFRPFAGYQSLRLTAKEVSGQLISVSMLVDFKDAVSATVALAATQNYRLDLDEESSMRLRPVYGQPPVAPHVVQNHQPVQNADQRGHNGTVTQHAPPPLGIGLGQAMDLSSFSHATAETDDMQVESPTPAVIRNNFTPDAYSGGVGDGRQVNMQQPMMQQQQQHRPEAQFAVPQDRPVHTSVARFQGDDRQEMHGMQNSRALVNNAQMGPPPSANLMYAQNPNQFGPLPPHMRPVTSAGGQLMQQPMVPEQQVHTIGAPQQLQTAPTHHQEGAQQLNYPRQELHLHPNQQQNTGGPMGGDGNTHQGQEMRMAAAAFPPHDPRGGQMQLYPGQFPQPQTNLQGVAPGPMTAQPDARLGPQAFDSRNGMQQTHDPRLGPEGQQMDPRQLQYEQQRGQQPPQQYDARAPTQQPAQTQQANNVPQARYASQPPSNNDMQKGRDGPWGPPVPQSSASAQAQARVEEAGPGQQRRFVPETTPYRSPPDRGTVQGVKSAAEERGAQGATRNYAEPPATQGNGGGGGARRQTSDAPQRRGSSREPVGRGGGNGPDSRDEKSKRQRNGGGPSSGDNRDGRDGSSRSRGAPRSRSRDSRAPSRSGTK